jgi:hypothetical protein
MLMLLALPTTTLAYTPKTLTGVVTGFTPSGITFTNGTAAKYSAELAMATLTRKNGATMTLSEILVGDKVQVTGTLWGDNSINAASLEDLSLYAHNSSFTAKITGIDPTDSSFTMQSKTYGTQTVSTNNFTTFSKNGSSATFKDLQLGMGVTVKALWDRSTQNILASQVQGTLRLIDIYFTGNISMLTSSTLTVIGNGNVIYGIDISKTLLESKNSKPILYSDFKIGDSLRVWGKHVSGSVQIVGVKVIDSSLTK